MLFSANCAYRIHVRVLYTYVQGVSVSPITSGMSLLAGENAHVLFNAIFRVRYTAPQVKSIRMADAPATAAGCIHPTSKRAKLHSSCGSSR